MHSFSRILVPIDGSEGSRVALLQALELAAACGGQVTVLSVIEDFGPLPGLYDKEPPGQDRVTWLSDRRFSAMESVLAQTSVPFTREVREGFPADAICGFAADQGHDLIVIGSRGLSSVARFLTGSVSERVVRHAPCSVMVVRDE